jgi:hypothetical protein
MFRKHCVHCASSLLWIGCGRAEHAGGQLEKRRRSSNLWHLAGICTSSTPGPNPSVPLNIHVSDVVVLSRQAPSSSTWSPQILTSHGEGRPPRYRGPGQRSLLRTSPEKQLTPLNPPRRGRARGAVQRISIYFYPVLPSLKIDHDSIHRYARFTGTPSFARFSGFVWFFSVYEHGIDGNHGRTPVMRCYG